MKTDNVYETEFAQSILIGLQYKSNRYGMYYGTADPAKVAKNRRVNKVARRQRNLNRRNTGRP